jgi:hypothetical protein
MSKADFTPISIGAFVSDYLKNNPGEDRESITASLKDALDAHKESVRLWSAAIFRRFSGNAAGWMPDVPRKQESGEKSPHSKGRRGMALCNVRKADGL